MREFISQWWLDALFGVILAGLMFWFRTLAKKISIEREETKAIKDGLKALLHDRIITLGRKYEQQGYCSTEDFEEFEELYIPYHEGLKGNGSGTRMYEIVENLSTAPNINKVAAEDNSAGRQTEDDAYDFKLR